MYNRFAIVYHIDIILNKLSNIRPIITFILLCFLSNFYYGQSLTAEDYKKSKPNVYIKKLDRLYGEIGDYFTDKSVPGQTDNTKMGKLWYGDPSHYAAHIKNPSVNW